MVRVICSPELASVGFDCKRECTVSLTDGRILSPFQNAEGHLQQKTIFFVWSYNFCCPRKKREGDVRGLKD